jgi:uncharacterized CHY-type Zn-finger protein
MKTAKPTDRQMALRIFFLMALVLMFSATSGGSLLAAPKKLATAKAGDCAACHGADKVLPDGHAPTAAMNGETCLGCHQKGSPLALYTKMPLSHFHQLKGVTCQVCHADLKAPQALSTEQCLACHGSFEKVAARTANVKPHNPHSSPHGNPYTACDLCHHQHAKSENFCAQCHAFKFVVP